MLHTQLVSYFHFPIISHYRQEIYYNFHLGLAVIGSSILVQPVITSRFFCEPTTAIPCQLD